MNKEDYVFMSDYKAKRILISFTICSILAMAGCGQGNGGTPEPTTAPASADTATPGSSTDASASSDVIVKKLGGDLSDIFKNISAVYKILIVGGGAGDVKIIAA